MLRIPEVEEVMELGKELGFDFTPTEAVIVQERIANSLEGLDKFYEMRIEEEHLPLRYSHRARSRWREPSICSIRTSEAHSRRLII
jgi:amidase